MVQVVLKIISGTLNIEKGVTNYGIYNTGTTTFYDGSINVNEATTGYGVRKINGIFRSFDGWFVGSTEAKPEAPTQIEEPDYEVVFGTDEDGYNYSTLKYLEQH